MKDEYAVHDGIGLCEYGGGSGKLNVPTDRQIYVNSKGKIKEELTFEVTIKGERFANIYDAAGTGFCTCSSPYLLFRELNMTAKGMAQAGVEDIQQLKSLAAMKGIPPVKCEPIMVLPWQSEVKNTEVAYGTALVEEAWTICGRGLGKIVAVESGQIDRSNNQQIAALLEKVEKIVDDYMRDKGIDKKYRQELLDSMLLYFGYPSIVPWNKKSTYRTNEFINYVKNEHMGVYNALQQPLIWTDPKTGKEVDLSYFYGCLSKDEKGSKVYYGNMVMHYQPFLLDDANASMAYIDYVSLFGELAKKSDMTKLDMIRKYYDLDENGNSKTGNGYDAYKDALDYFNAMMAIMEINGAHSMKDGKSPIEQKENFEAWYEKYIAPNLSQQP